MNEPISQEEGLMRLPNDEPPRCARCETKPGVKEYTLQGVTEMVCATCFDRRSVEDALEAELLHMYELGSVGKFDEAMACADAVLAANRHRDHDGWLARSVAAHHVLLLLDARRYPEALQASHALADLGFADAWERWMHALGKAHALEPLGRDREAMAALEDALGYEDEKQLPSVLGVLTELARLSEKLSETVDRKWLRIAEAVAKRHGVEMPMDDSPAKAILALEEIVQSRQ